MRPPTDHEARTDDAQLVSALLAGDAAAFERVVTEWGGLMQRVARVYVHDAAVAEDVVQETWIAFLEGLPGFAMKSSLKTWAFRILTHRAATRARREARIVPMSALDAGRTVPAERFRPHGDPEYPGHWADPPQRWRGDPARRAESVEMLEVIDRAIRELPEAQAMVIVLRDVAGFAADEVCAMLEVSAGNQRVLLHRARARVRAVLEEFYGGVVP